MKLWHRVISLLSFTLFCCSLTFSQPAQALNLNTIIQGTPHLLAVEAVEDERRNVADDLLGTEYGSKIDLNNTSLRDFRELRGFYPKLASLIVQNAPYDSVEEVLSIPGLTESQKERLQANLDKFSVSPPADVFTEGDERYNPGVY